MTSAPSIGGYEDVCLLCQEGMTHWRDEIIDLSWFAFLAEHRNAVRALDDKSYDGPIVRQGGRLPERPWVHKECLAKVGKIIR